VSGGGYGVLARLRGITVDWLSTVDILTVNGAGKVSLAASIRIMMLLMTRA
jgi:hypothetical protein